MRAAPGYAAYAAAKAGVINYTRTAAFELARHGIRVNAIAVGSTASSGAGMSDGWLVAVDAAGRVVFAATKFNCLATLDDRRSFDPESLLATLAYGAAALLVGAALVHTGWRSGRLVQHMLGNPLDLVLVVGLLMAAVYTDGAR